MTANLQDEPLALLAGVFPASGGAAGGVVAPRGGPVVSGAGAANLAAPDLSEHQGHRVLRIRGRGKTEKNHRIPLNAPTVTALDRWLCQRATIAGADAATGPLLLSPTTGRPLTRQAIYGLINRLARSAGVGQLTPHGLRATMVTLALGAGMPLRDVQDSARHADPRTTRRYDRDRHSLNRHAALRLAELADPKPRS